MDQDRRQASSHVPLVVAATAIPAAALLIMFVFKREIVAGGPIVITALEVAPMVAISLICGRYWKRLDEAAQAAHRSAWYWGGQAGLGIAFVFALVVNNDKTIAAPIVEFVTSGSGRVSPVALAFFYGVAFAGLGQVAGYLVAWFRWWLVRRSA